MGFIGQAFQYYKQLKMEEKQRKRLLATQIDYGALQAMVNRAEDNPNLKIRITLNSGEKVEIVSEKQRRSTSFSDYINGDEDVLEIN